MFFFSFPPLLLVTHCIFIFMFKKWLGPVGTFYASILSFLVVILTLLVDLSSVLVLGNYYFIDFGRWFFCLDLIDSHLVFCMDLLAIISALLVLLLTLFALYFGVEYMYREAFINRLLYLLNMFATSVIFLFFCFDFFLILFSWECIGLFSFLLVNFYSSRVYTIKAALKTFVFSRISDMFMFFTFIMSISIFNTTDLSLIFIQAPFFSFHYIFIGDFSLHFLTIYSLSLCMSGSIKSAQFFFHVWLPDAMEAPTPASALIHSSTLVVAGIYLIIRFSVIMEFAMFTNYFLILLGAVTLVFGAITATFQNDIKKLVAYSTISQIGYLTCGCGFGCYEEVLLYLIIHALNKAFLFVLVGYTVHFFSGNTDMRQMGGAYIYSFDIAVLFFAVAFNLAGLPYSAGFIAKEFLLLQVFKDDFISTFVRACWLISFFFTPIYMFMLTFIVQFGIKKGSVSVYSSVWNYSLSNNLSTLNTNQYITYLHKFQFTSITSRLTTFILIGFWLFFTFFGEYLLLLLLNFSSTYDTINSSNFMTIKQHIIHMISLNPLKLHTYLNLYLYMLIFNAFMFMVNFNYKNTYNLDNQVIYHIMIPLLSLSILNPLIFILNLLIMYFVYKK